MCRHARNASGWSGRVRARVCLRDVIRISRTIRYPRCVYTDAVVLRRRPRMSLQGRGGGGGGGGGVEDEPERNRHSNADYNIIMLCELV